MINAKNRLILNGKSWVENLTYPLLTGEKRQSHYRDKYLRISQQSSHNYVEVRIVSSAAFLVFNNSVNLLLLASIGTRKLLLFLIRKKQVVYL